MKRRTLPILLLYLMLIPVIWNGASMVHYLVEHTHALCNTTDEHIHVASENCLTICVVDNHQSEGQILTVTDYKELNIYLLVPQILTIVSVGGNQPQQFLSPTLLNHLYSNDIFHPPIEYFSLILSSIFHANY